MDLDINVFSPSRLLICRPFQFLIINITAGQNWAEFAPYSGTASNVFPRNTFLKTLFAVQSTFRYLEMHFKRRYKICICSVILGELESYRNYKGFSISITDFPENSRCNLTYHESEDFSYSLSTGTLLNPKILVFLF